MVAIAPFLALRYDPAGVDLAKVTSPPHDTISPEQRDAFLVADARNIVKVVLPPEQPGDVEPPAGPDQPTGPNKFLRAAATLKAWQADGTMFRDPRPAFYHYAATHGPPGDRRTMHAFFARIRLDPTYKEIRRHEKTLHRFKRERLHLRRATRTDTEPIWLLYRDTRGWVEEILASNAFDEIARCTDETGTEHRLWRVDRPEAVAEIVAQFDDRSVVIADGHHRYQTALDHYAATGKATDGSILVALVRDNDSGLRIEATHRLLHGLAFDVVAAVQKAESHWVAEPVVVPPDVRGAAVALDAAAGAAGSTDLLLLGKQGRYLVAWRLRLKKGSKLNTGRGRLDSLAVSVLHERLLRDCWGLNMDKPEDHLRFARGTVNAVEAVVSGACQFAVFPPAEPVAAVLEVAEQGHVMPQKATYFVPKLRSGLVLGPLDEPQPRTWQEIAGDGGKADWRMPPLG